MANYSHGVWEIGFLKANADMSSNQYKFVTTGSVAGEFKLANGASGPVPLGVLQDDPKQGEAGNIRVAGTTKIYAEGDTDIGYGDWVIATSVGGVKVNVTASTMGMGIALEAATAAGSANIIQILLTPWAHVMIDNTP